MDQHQHALIRNMHAANLQTLNNNGDMMQMTLVLKVSQQCMACKRKLDEVLQCTQGHYTSFTMDAEAQKVKITGRVDPGVLMQVLSRSDGHGEVALIQLNKNGDSAYEYYYKYDHHGMTNYGNPYNHHPHDDPYVYNGHYQAALPVTDPCYHHHRYRSQRCLCNIM